MVSDNAGHFRISQHKPVKLKLYFLEVKKKKKNT